MTTTNPEDAAQGQPLKRRNSRFLLEETKDKKSDEKDQVMYRPEFGAKDGKANEKLWELMSSYIGSDKKSIQRSIVNHVEYTLARTRFNFDNFGAYQAASLSVRDRLIEAWNDTN
jgi:starch phosphorylase